MEITLNGRPRRLHAPTSVGAMVDGESPDRRGIAVAIDGQVVPRNRWDDTLVDEGSSIEIVGAVQGG